MRNVNYIRIGWTEETKHLRYYDPVNKCEGECEGEKTPEGTVLIEVLGRTVNRVTYKISKDVVREFGELISTRDVNEPIS